MSDQQRRCVVVVLAAVALATAVSPRPAAAQTSTNNAGIEGRVTDDSGAVLPGVTVTIKSPALQSAQLEAVTDAAGRYRFTTLPGGEYTVTFSLPGFRTMVRQGLKLGSGFVATVDAQLALGQLEESITVTGDSPLVDVRTTTEATNIKKELMETIPTSRAYADVGKLAPGVRLSGLPDVGGSQTGGQRGNLVSYGSNAGGQTLMLDGVNTDGTGGYFDFGAIEEMIVRPGGNDAEIPTSGMAFQIITKSGGNDFHGDGLAAWQGQNLQGNNIDDELRQKGVTGGNPMDHYYDVNGSLGGRILRDRLWFFGSARRKEYGQEVLGYSGGPGPDGAYFTADDEQGTQTDRESNVVGKLTAQPGTKHRLSWMNQYGVKATDDRTASVFIPHEAAVNYSLPVNTYKGDWTYTPSNRSVLIASIGRSWYKSQGLPYSDLPSTFDVVTQRWGGATVNSVGTGDDAAPAGSWSQRWQYDASYSYFLPHPASASTSSRSAARSPASGTTQAGAPQRRPRRRRAGLSALLLQRQRRSKCCSTTRRSRARTTSTIRAGSCATTGGSAIGSRSTSACASSATTSTCRSSRSRPARSPRRPTTRKTDLYDWRALAPRIGLSYALTADNRTVVKATYGRFNHAIRPSNTPDPPQPQRQRIRSHALPLDRPERQRIPAVSGRARRVHPDRGRIDHAWHLQPRHRTAANRRSDAALRAPAGLAAVGPRRLRLQEGVQSLPAGERRASVRASTTSRSPSSTLARTASPATRTTAARSPTTTTTRPSAGRSSSATSPSTSRGYTQPLPQHRGRRRQAARRRMAAAGVVPGDEERRVDRRRARRRRTRSSSRRTRPGTRPSARPAATSRRWGLMASTVFEYQSGTAQARDVLFRTGLAPAEHA